MDLSFNDMEFLDKELEAYLQKCSNDVAVFNNLDENPVIETSSFNQENGQEQNFLPIDFSFLELESSNILKAVDNLPEKIVDSNISYNECNIQDTKVTQPKRRKKSSKAWETKMARYASSCGLEHMNRKGVVVPEKVMGPPCSCRMGCYKKIDEETRKTLFHEFWRVFNWEQRIQYTAILVIETPKQRSRSRKSVPTNRRQSTYKYTLLKDGEFMTVCRIMFHNTFAISDKFVRWSIMKKRISPNGIIGPDKFGKYSAKIKKSEEVREAVRDHIRSFSTVVLENADNEGVKMFLDSSLNIALMYKLYVKQCQQKGMPDVDIVNEIYYRRIFKTEFNIKFKNFSKNALLEQHDYSSNSSC